MFFKGGNSTRAFCGYKSSNSFNIDFKIMRIVIPRLDNSLKTSLNTSMHVLTSLMNSEPKTLTNTFLLYIFGVVKNDLGKGFNSTFLPIQ